MPLTEGQIKKERLYSFTVYPKMRVIRDSPSIVYENGVTPIENPNTYKKGDIVTNFRSWGSMVCWDENGKWYSFYDLEIIK